MILKEIRDTKREYYPLLVIKSPDYRDFYKLATAFEFLWSFLFSNKLNDVK
jgi:hypothetical protein